MESSVGMGHIAKVFEDKGHNVTGYDIIDRGWHDTIVADYLLVDRLPECCNNGCMIVENTPFKHSVEFISHGMDLINNGDYICSLQKIQFWKAKDVRNFLRNIHQSMYACSASVQIHTETEIWINIRVLPCVLRGLFFKKGIMEIPLLSGFKSKAM